LMCSQCAECINICPVGSLALKDKKSLSQQASK
jgi:NAD-dependent dihydropyrimidine dehydrogenase PreA subunit